MTTDIKPGIYYELEDADYRAIRAWSPSLVTSGLVSMLQLDYDRKHPPEPTPQMIFGTAVHCSVLEPDLFPLRYVIWTGGRKAGKEWDQFEAANDGKTVLAAKQYQSCIGARNAVRNHTAARKVLDNARTEVSVVWRDHATGLLCKGRLDIVGTALADLKTTTAQVADERALKRIASDLAYDLRLAAYHAGLSAHLGVGNVPPVKIIFVEQAPPHDVKVKTVAADSLAKGWDKWQGILERIAVCELSGVWPGCDDGESELDFFGGDDVNITLDGESLT